MAIAKVVSGSYKEQQSGITRGALRRMFHYDPDTGHLTWADCPMPQHNGTRAGTQSAKGARKVSVQGKLHTESRVIWFWMKGAWPPFRLIHRDGDASNNRWGNIQLSHIPNVGFYANVK